MCASTATRTAKQSSLLRTATDRTGMQNTLPFSHHPSLTEKITEKSNSDGALDISFSLLGHGEDRKRGWVREASRNSRHNIGNFYRSLYKGLFFNGFAPEEKDYTINLDEGPRHFRPDLIMNGLFGTDFIEIKSRFRGTSKQPCGVSQFENYSFALLQKIKEERMPSVNYAFFMYGTNREPLKLYRINPEDAMDNLSKSTTELLVIPLNMALALSRMSRSEVRSTDETYIIFSGHLLRKLHKEATTDMNELIDYQGKRYGVNKNEIDAVKEFAMQPTLCMDQLVVHNKMSDEVRKLRYNDTEITPFPITIYSLKDEEKWNKSFFKHGTEILDGLGMRNIYAEWTKTILPF
jgi:hypothetical protein